LKTFNVALVDVGSRTDGKGLLESTLKTVFLLVNNKFHEIFTYPHINVEIKRYGDIYTKDYQIPNTPRKRG